MASSTYLHGHHESVLAAHRRRTAENSCAYLLDHLHRGATVLDVGCGPGTITVDLARIVAPGTVVALDAEIGMLQATAALAAERQLDNVTVVLADAMALPWPDATFDIVHLHQVLQHVPDPRALLRECRRVCRPGGIVAARDADYAGFLWSPLDPDLDRWQTLYEQVARALGGRAGRRALPARMGQRRGLSRGHRIGKHMGVRNLRRTGLVGRVLGETGPAVGFCDDGSRHATRPSRRARRHQPGLVALGTRAHWVAPRASRRNPRAAVSSTMSSTRCATNALGGIASTGPREEVHPYPRPDVLA